MRAAAAGTRELERILKRAAAEDGTTPRQLRLERLVTDARSCMATVKHLLPELRAAKATARATKERAARRGVANGAEGSSGGGVSAVGRSDGSAGEGSRDSTATSGASGRRQASVRPALANLSARRTNAGRESPERLRARMAAEAKRARALAAARAARVTGTPRPADAQRTPPRPVGYGARDTMQRPQAYGTSSHRARDSM